MAPTLGSGDRLKPFHEKVSKLAPEPDSGAGARFFFWPERNQKKSGAGSTFVSVPQPWFLRSHRYNPFSSEFPPPNILTSPQPPLPRVNFREKRSACTFQRLILQYIRFHHNGGSRVKTAIFITKSPRPPKSGRRFKVRKLF